MRGRVTSGYGEATRNLNPVAGTLNVDISEEYIVRADAFIYPEEYPRNKLMNEKETIKLQRCVVGGYKALIMRPDSHELGTGRYHGKKHLELMGPRNFREALQLENGSFVEVAVEGDEEWWSAGV